MYNHDGPKMAKTCNGIRLSIVALELGEVEALRGLILLHLEGERRGRESS